MNIVFLGAPGSGKGTQSVNISKRLNIPTISTGDILRKEISEKSEVGVLAKGYVDSGDLVPDEVVVDIVKKRISDSDCDKGFILDGFPRNVNQAVILDKMTESIGKKIEAAINFDVDFDTLIKRISGRFFCKKCNAIYNRHFKPTSAEGVCDSCGSKEFSSRDDDNESTVRNRLQVYKETSFDLIDFYKKNGLLITVEALKSPALLCEDLILALSKI